MTEQIEIWDAVKQTKYKRTFEQLHDIISNAKKDVDGAIVSTLNVVCNISHSEAGTFWFYDRSGDGLIRARAVYGGADLSNIRLMPGEGVAGKVIETGELSVVSDVDRNKNWTSKVDKKTNFSTKSMVCVPLKARDTVFGCIQLLNKVDGSYYDDNDIELVVNLATEISKLCLKYNILIDEKSFANVAVLSVGMKDILEGSEEVETDNLFRALRDFISIIEEPIKKYGGTVDKYDYDNILVYWAKDDIDEEEEDKPEGAIQDEEDIINEEVLNACKTAKEIIEKRGALQNEIANKYRVAFGLTAGIAYGPAYVGDIGTRTTSNHTIVGQTVDKAKLLKDKAKYGQIYVEENAAGEVSKQVSFIRVKEDLFSKNKSNFNMYLLEDLSKY